MPSIRQTSTPHNYHRKSNRLQNYDYSQYGAYFITICVQDRHEILCKIVDSSNNNNTSSRDAETSSPTTILTEYGETVESTLKSIHLDNANLSVDAYVIMPDHVHFVLTIAPIVGADVLGGPYNMTSTHHNPQTQIVPRIITWFKRLTNQKIGFNIWQRSYHDHIIRNEQDYRNICQYINENPMRWLQKSLMNVPTLICHSILRRRKISICARL